MNNIMNELTLRIPLEKQKQSFAFVFSQIVCSLMSVVFLLFGIGAFLYGGLPSLAAGAFFLPAFAFGLMRLSGCEITQKQADVCFAFVAVLSLIFITIAVIFLKSSPIRDLLVLDTSARNLAENFSPSSLYLNQPERQDYYARYPNNLALLFILTGCYKLGINPIFLSAFAIFATIVLIYLTARLMFSPKTSLVCGILCVLFPAFFLYVPFYYTDVFSMPFIMLSCYLCILGIEKNKSWAVWVCGIIICLAMKIKGSAVILLPACIIYFLFRQNREKIISRLKSCLALLAAFSIALSAISAAFSQSGLVSREEYNESKFPYTHWIMMGAGGNGGYSENDVLATSSAGDFDAKSEFTVQELKNRLSELGLGGIIVHYTCKAFRTWCDGSFFINQGYLENGDENFIRSAVLNSKLLYGYMGAVASVILLFICLSFFKGRGKQKEDSALQSCSMLIKLAVCGILCFLLIWETRSRYLVSFTPLLILCAADGIEAFFNNGKKFR